jgi:hypothetical protein
MSEETKPEAEAKAKPAPIPVEEGGLKPTNANQLMTVIKNVSDGKGFPECFKTQAEQIAAYNLAHSLMGGQWQLALNHMAFVKGKLTIYGELPGALAHRTGQVENWKLFAIDKDHKEICVENKNLDSNPYAGVLRVKRKGQEQCEYTYTINEAQVAGQYPATKWDKQTREQVPNPDSPWMKFTKIMLMRKAQSLGVKFQFPEALVGVPIAEYDFDEAPDLVPVKDVTPVNRAGELNNRFGGNDGNTN